MDETPVWGSRENGPRLGWPEREGSGTGKESLALGPGARLSSGGLADGKMPPSWREMEKSLGLVGGEMGNVSKPLNQINK